MHISQKDLIKNIIVYIVQNSVIKTFNAFVHKVKFLDKTTRVRIVNYFNKDFDILTI